MNDDLLPWYWPAHHNRRRVKAWCLFVCGVWCIWLPQRYGLSIWWTMPIYLLASWLVEELVEKSP